MREAKAKHFELEEREKEAARLREISVQAERVRVRQEAVLAALEAERRGMEAEELRQREVIEYGVSFLSS